MGTQKGLSRVTIVSMIESLALSATTSCHLPALQQVWQLLEEVRGKWKTWRRVLLEVTQNPGRHRVSLPVEQ